MDDREGRIKDIILTSICSCSFIGFLFSNYFLLFKLSGSPYLENIQEDLTFTIIISIFGLLYFVFYIINLYIIKREKWRKICNIISSCTCFFFLVAIIINLVSSIDKLFFDENNLTILLTSSFTLLGFGLTISAILFQPIIKKIQSYTEIGKLDSGVLDSIALFILLFVMGFISSLSVLLNLQYIDTVYFKVLVFRSLFYSVAQIFMVIVNIISLFLPFLIEKVK